MNLPRKRKVKEAKEVSDSELFKLGMADTDYIATIDNDTLSHKANESKKASKSPKSTEDTVLSWSYVSVNEMIKLPEVEYDTSCDELELEEKDTFDGIFSKKSLFKGTRSDSEASGISLGSCDSPHDSTRDNDDSESEYLSGHSGSPKKRKREDDSASPSDYGKDKEDTFILDTQDKSDKPPCKKQKINDDGDFCVGCFFGSIEKEVTIGKAINALLNIIHENYGSVDNFLLAKSVHRVYKAKVYNKCKKLGIPCPMWRTKSIKNHIEKHWRDPRVFIGETDRRLLYEILAINDMIFRRENYLEGNSQVVCDVQLSKHRNELIKLRAALLKLDPKKLVFFNDKRNIDMEKIGGFINPQTFIRISTSSI
jgi:hypothetical protein